LAIIDFRLRPPLKGFLQTRIYSAPENRNRYTRSLGFEPAPSAEKQSIELLLSEMKRAGITRGVVVGRATDKLGTIANSDVAEIVAEHPETFVPVGSAHPADRRQAVRQIEEARRLGCRLVNLEPGALSPPIHVDDRRLYPIYAYCEDERVPLIVMCGGAAGPDISYTAPQRIDRVLSDFPELVVVASHGGWPWVQEVLHVAFRRPNLYVSPDMYLGLPGMHDYLLAANGFLADRFLFGTAYPFCPLEPYADWFRSLPIKAAAMDRILYANAARLLGLET
jgi:predicted TIM-barrel fold metal-dependent hydrolase